MNFLKETGIVPPPITHYFIRESLFILIIGIILIIIFCKTININFPEISIRRLIKREMDEWEKKFYRKLLWQYPIWGFVQQFFMVVIFVFIRKLVSDYNAVLITSAIFVVLHYPNLFLGLLVFGLEQMFLNHFMIFRNLYALGIFHGVFATLLLFFSPSVLYTKFYILTDYIKLYRNEEVEEGKDFIILYINKVKDTIEDKILKNKNKLIDEENID
ncbi:MAG: hypothetical protein NUV32_03120 [Exilispira sp.]|jgi:hypothetical protein|nr:hypothetical protein [Exilispira sp.]